MALLEERTNLRPDPVSFLALVPSIDGPARGALTRAPEILAASPSVLADHASTFVRWLALIRGRAPATVAAYTADLTSFLGFCALGRLAEPDQVAPRHVEAYLAWIQRDRGVNAHTANRHLHALRAWWRWMMREGAASRDPAALTELLRAPKRLPKYLSKPERHRVLTELARDTGPHGWRDRALIASALYAGLRCEELATLRVDAVDLGARKLRVVGKGDKERELPIARRLHQILGFYLEHVRPRLTARHPCPWVFVHVRERGPTQRTGAPLLTRSIHALVRDRVSPIIGRPAHPHTLRHTFASMLRAAGADLALIQESLGHTNIQTTLIYAHLATPRRIAELDRLLDEEDA